MSLLNRLILGGLFVSVCGLSSAAVAIDTASATMAKRAMTIDRLYSLPSIIGTAPENPTWSPDSRRLAFLWNDAGMPFRDIWLTDAHGGKPVRVTHMPQI